MDALAKNVFDLRHSLNLTKGSMFLSVGIGGAIAIFFGLREVIINEQLFYMSFLLSFIWLMIFGWVAILHFERCNKIQKIIEKSIKRKNEII